MYVPLWDLIDPEEISSNNCGGFLLNSLMIA